jgi:hypothetical protein
MYRSMLRHVPGSKINFKVRFNIHKSNNIDFIEFADLHRVMIKYLLSEVRSIRKVMIVSYLKSLYSGDRASAGSVSFKIYPAYISSGMDCIILMRNRMLACKNERMLPSHRVVQIQTEVCIWVY